MLKKPNKFGDISKLYKKSFDIKINKKLRKGNRHGKE